MLIIILNEIPHIISIKLVIVTTFSFLIQKKTVRTASMEELIEMDMVVSGTITTHKTVVIMMMMTLQQKNCVVHAKVTHLLIIKFFGTEKI